MVNYWPQDVLLVKRSILGQQLSEESVVRLYDVGRIRAEEEDVDDAENDEENEDDGNDCNFLNTGHVRYYFKKVARFANSISILDFFVTILKTERSSNSWQICSFSDQILTKNRTPFVSGISRASEYQTLNVFYSDENGQQKEYFGHQLFYSNDLNTRIVLFSKDRPLFWDSYCLVFEP